jgi:hypothetical protein
LDALDIVTIGVCVKEAMSTKKKRNASKHRVNHDSALHTTH